MKGRRNAGIRFGLAGLALLMAMTTAPNAQMPSMSKETAYGTYTEQAGRVQLIVGTVIAGVEAVLWGIYAVYQRDVATQLLGAFTVIDNGAIERIAVHIEHRAFLLERSTQELNVEVSAPC